MRYTVLGVGGLGGVLGGYLKKAGFQVDLIDVDKNNVNVILDRELEVRPIEGPFRVTIDAYTPEDYKNSGKNAECVLLAVKTQDIHTAVDFISPLLAQDGFIVPFQPGFYDVFESLEKEGKIVYGVTSMQADLLEAGLIHCGYKGTMVLGEPDGSMTQRVKKLAEDLAVVCDTRMSDDINSWRWAFLAYNAMLAGASVTNEMMRDQFGNTRWRSILEHHFEEVMDVGVRHGAKLDDVSWDGFVPSKIYPIVCNSEGMWTDHVKYMCHSTKVHSGVWRDLAVNKKASEVLNVFNAFMKKFRGETVHMPACKYTAELISNIESCNASLFSVVPQSVMNEYELRIREGRLKITIVGAGAIGCVVGGYLAKCGRNVEFITRSAHNVAVMNEYGLEVREQRMSDDAVTFVAHAPFYTTEQYVERGEKLECILLCVKAQHTKAALEPLLPLMTADTFVVSVQNGITEFEIAEVVGKERTVSGFVNIGADIINPGLVHFGTRGPVVAGEWDGGDSERVQRLAKEMTCYDMFHTSLNPMGYVWAKVAYSAITVVTTITNETVAITIAKERYHEMMANVVAEALEVALAEGVDLTGTAFDKFDPELVVPIRGRSRDKVLAMMKEHATIMRGTTKVHSGTWRDIVIRKREAESHAHFAPIFKLAEKHGIEMPLCRYLLNMLKELEDGKREFSDDNLEELLAKDLEFYPR